MQGCVPTHSVREPCTSSSPCPRSSSQFVILPEKQTKRPDGTDDWFWCKGDGLPGYWVQSKDTSSTPTILNPARTVAAASSSGMQNPSSSSPDKANNTAPSGVSSSSLPFYTWLCFSSFSSVSMMLVLPSVVSLQEYVCVCMCVCVWMCVFLFSSHGLGRCLRHLCVAHHDGSWEEKLSRCRLVLLALLWHSL